MEISIGALTNQKWRLCAIASLLVLLLLSFRFDQAHRSLPFLFLPVQVTNSTNTTITTIFSAVPPQSSTLFSPPPPPPKLSPPPPMAKKAIAPAHTPAIEPPSLNSSTVCDITDGKWVYDPKTYPLYNEDRCPFLSDQVVCLKNGRPDSGYQHWRWQPRGCTLPRYLMKCLNDLLVLCLILMLVLGMEVKVWWSSVAEKTEREACCDRWWFSKQEPVWIFLLFALLFCQEAFSRFTPNVKLWLQDLPC